MAEFVTLFTADELEEGGMRRVMVGEEALVIVHQGGEWFALRDCCSHETARLSEGYLEPGLICCALHGAAFDLRSGEVLRPPAYEGIATRPVRVEAGLVQVAKED
jgi:nitrite reductase/ring-hydroxylating ferredoxin subunit